MVLLNTIVSTTNTNSCPLRVGLRIKCGHKYFKTPHLLFASYIAPALLFPLIWYSSMCSLVCVCELDLLLIGGKNKAHASAFLFYNVVCFALCGKINSVDAVAEHSFNHKLAVVL